MDLVNILKEQVTLETMFKCYAILVGFDVLTGLTKAVKNGRLKSRTLRDGMFVSFGEIIFLMLCIISTEILPITHWVVFFIIIFMCLKELTSVVENLVEINVKVVPTWLLKALAVYTDKLDKGE